MRKAPDCVSEVDNVVVGAVNEQEAQLVAIDGRVADRRRFEINPPVHHRRSAEKFFDDRIARPRDLVMGPLRQQIVDAIKADNGLDAGGHGGMSVVAIG